MTNLLRETLDKLEKHNKKEAQIAWVGAEDGTYKTTWEDFKSLAHTIDYDQFGGALIAIDLVVVGRRRWWLRRNIWREYDGGYVEGWEYVTAPRLSSRTKQIIRMTHDQGWDEQSLEGIHETTERKL